MKVKMLLVLAICFLLALAVVAQSKGTAQPAAKSDDKSEVGPGKEKGPQQRFFAFPKEKVKEALLDALKSLEFEVKKDAGDNIEAQKKRHVGVFVGSGGEKVVFHLADAEEGGTKGTRVTGETKKGFVGRAGQKSWTNAVLDQTAKILKGE